MDLATGKAQDSVEAIGNDIVLVFDISNSMAEDEHGNSTSSNDKKNVLLKLKTLQLSFWIIVKFLEIKRIDIQLWHLITMVQ